MHQTDEPSIETLIEELNALKRYLTYLEHGQLRGNAALEAFQRVSLSITTSLDLHVVLNTILEGTMALLDANDAHIFLYQNSRLRFAAALDRSGPSPQALWEPRPDGLSYRVARGGETIAIPNLREHELFQDTPPDWHGGIIGQPLRIGDRVVGVMNVGFGEPHEFSSDELLLLRMLGDQAAIAIENAYLFGEAERRAKLLDAVRRVNMSITASLDLSVVLETILEGTMELFTDISETHIFFYEEAGNLRFGAGRTREGFTKAPYAEPRRGGLTYTVAQTGETVTVPQIKGHPMYMNAPAQWGGAIVGQPLKIGSRVVGVMNVGYSEPQEFSATDLYVLGLLGDQAAVAIENARLYERIRRDAEELEMRVSERTAELSAYSHTVAHDLRSPLLMIMGYADLLDAKYRDAIPPKAADYVTHINNSSRRMADMIGQLLRLAELRDAAVSAEPVEVAPRVEAALNRFQDRILERPITVEIAPDLPTAMGHAIWIEEIFANLISNAIQYIGKDNPNCRIWIRGEAQDQWLVRYEVRDNGLGIPLDKQEQIFQMFSRAHPGEAKGFGLGLSIVHRIVTNLNGQLGVESDGMSGSTFWFTLPACPTQSA